jgi:hypothetical protein
METKRALSAYKVNYSQPFTGVSRMDRILLTITICLIIGIVSTTNIDAQVTWFGFSELCFEYEDKGQEGDKIEVDLVDITVHTGCYNIQSGAFCQPGLGNAGGEKVTVFAAEDPNKVKGTVTANGCIPLSRFDTHSHEEHIHTCHPTNNSNKEEILGSAMINSIETTWKVTRTNKKGIEKLIKRGVQQCTYPGTIDPNTCIPEHGLQLQCSIDEVFEK